MIEPLLLTAARISTFHDRSRLTNASGFFFERDERLFLVTSRHVLFSKTIKHYPTRIEIELHTNAANIAESTDFSIPLYRNGNSLWRHGTDAAGEIDVAVIEIDRKALPPTAVYRAFKPQHLLSSLDQVEVGSSLLIVGFPLGFHDALHHTPVVRHAIIASSFGLRFQGEAFFLTDARTHRGSSGAPVVMRIAESATAHDDLPWMLLGIHSSRFDVGNRDLIADEALGLNGAWYADILLKLTEKESA
jgi:S1-C subfamily serine protease